MQNTKILIIFGLFVFILQGCTHEQLIPNTAVNGEECRFTYENGSAKTVNLVGSFNNWDPFSLPMYKINKSTWTISLKLPKGIYYYQFVVNGKVWVVPPYAEAYARDGFGGKNAIITIQDGPK